MTWNKLNYSVHDYQEKLSIAMKFNEHCSYEIQCNYDCSNLNTFIYSLLIRQTMY